ncbi:hypothetical protein [Frigoribacterium sp. NPDC087798]|uniref:hypothetical protein n=1 Tax=Frigoribacterium sp. NPDC087798 TaxID=3363993 RepID=UPI0037FD4670
MLRKIGSGLVVAAVIAVLKVLIITPLVDMYVPTGNWAIDLLSRTGSWLISPVPDFGYLFLVTMGLFLMVMANGEKFQLTGTLLLVIATLWLSVTVGGLIRLFNPPTGHLNGDPGSLVVLMGWAIALIIVPVASVYRYALNDLLVRDVDWVIAARGKGRQTGGGLIRGRVECTDDDPHALNLGPGICERELRYARRRPLFDRWRGRGTYPAELRAPHSPAASYEEQARKTREVLRELKKSRGFLLGQDIARISVWPDGDRVFGQAQNQRWMSGARRNALREAKPDDLPRLGRGVRS